LIDADDLPSADSKLEIFSRAVAAFRGAGYNAIGMDHFALPEDDLGRAVEDGTLWRNFMGYTVQAAPDTVAFGASGISDVEGALVQNERKLSLYERAVAEGRLPAERGYVLSEDDKVRRHFITSLMCTFRLDVADVERRFGIDFHRTFSAEWEALAELERDGFVERHEDRLEVVGLGRQFVRNVCMVFDAYLGAKRDGPPRFSRTV
jgi:oxygen-independent coproporphyrinogen-3 oxidase